MSQDKRTVKGTWQSALETLRLTMGPRDLRGLRAAKQDRGRRQAPSPPCRWPSRHQEVLGTKGSRARPPGSPTLDSLGVENPGCGAGSWLVAGALRVTTSLSPHNDCTAATAIRRKGLESC